MSITEIRGTNIKDGSVQRQDLDTTTSGQAVITKVVAGSGISLSSTGVDVGTGDVTVNATARGGGTTVNVIDTTVSFGSAPGTNTATVTLSGQTGILTTSIVKARINIDGAGSSYNTYELSILELDARCTSIVDNTSCTITVTSKDKRLTGNIPIRVKWHN